jgi:hypothetical protein
LGDVTYYRLVAGRWNSGTSFVDAPFHENL